VNQKKDGYDLPTALKDWLYPSPSSGITRDYASLQVVFGRGEEYFASDKNGKLEYKEPAEIKKPTPSDEEENINGNKAESRQALRRSRTVSFLRPLSETSVRSDGSFASESSFSSSASGSGSGSGWSRSKRSSSSASSTRASRPPSLSFASSRTNSEASMLGPTIVEGEAVQTARPGWWTQQGKTGVGEMLQKQEGTGVSEEQSLEAGEKERVTSTSSPVLPVTSSTRTSAVSEDQGDGVSTTAPISTVHCTCGCHASSSSTSTSTSTYTNSSTQTSPRAPLRINTAKPSTYWSSSSAEYTATSQASTLYNSDDNDNDYYYHDDEQQVQAAPMGRMSMFFSKPGYQLGDSLFGGYQDMRWGEDEAAEEEDYGQVEYEYEYEYTDTFG